MLSRVLTRSFVILAQVLACSASAAFAKSPPPPAREILQQPPGPDEPTAAEKPAAGKLPAADTTADASINAALQSRDYPAAIARIDAALKASPKDADREFLLFRRGLALLYSAKHAEAIAQFDQQLKDFPAGPWADKARFRTADARVALKQFDAAEKIYADRVRALVGDDRKSRIAQVYMDFAAEFFAPADAFTKPDFEKARGFYERALELQPGENLRDAILYRRGLCLQKLNQWAEAAQQFEQYLLTFDPAYRELQKTRSAGVVLPTPSAQPGKNIVPARFALGECRLSMSQFAEARRAWQDLLALLDSPAAKAAIAAADKSAANPAADKSAADIRTPTATEEPASANPVLAPSHAQIRIQTLYLISKTYQMPTPPNAESLALGVQSLERLIAASPESKEAIRAAYDIGHAYAFLGRVDDAIAAFRNLIDRKSIKPADDDARKLAEELSQSALFEVGKLYFAQKKYADAIGAWNQYVAKYPSGPFWSASQQSIVDADYQLGADAVADKKYDLARESWTAFLQKYPLDPRAPAILFAFGDLSFHEQKWDDAIAHWRRLVNKFPNTEEAGHGQYMIGVTLEEKIQNLEAALDAYKALAWSSFAGFAQQRIAEMNATRLLLVTPRTFRINEHASVHVDARNIDKLTVKLYRIDMQDYFRKTHGIGGVEGLNLLLIDPDKTFDVDLTGFAKYKPIAQDIEIPIDGPAVYAVYISNEKSPLVGTQPGQSQKLEATTLLVSSDIDIIIKSSRRQLLVFAQNMSTMTPAANVHVLASDGSKVRLEGKTGQDGVWLAKSDDLKNLDRLSVLAYLEQGPSADASPPRHKSAHAPETPNSKLQTPNSKDSKLETPNSTDSKLETQNSKLHVAGNALSLEGLGFSTGLAPRGFIYTDRPTYRPGDAVNIRGIIREVKDGQYALPKRPDDPRQAWKLDIIDAKGRVLQTQDIWPTADKAQIGTPTARERATDAIGTPTAREGPANTSAVSASASTAATPPDFGSFAAQFRISDQAPVGEYKLIVRRVEGPTFAGSFQVQTYELPAAFLRFDFTDRVLMRGTPIKGSIVATYHYGEPVAGKTVEYFMADPFTGEQVNRTGVTDKDGKVAFEFDSTGFPEEARVMFSARQAELSIEAADSAFVAVRAFRAEIKTLRPLYLHEEPVEVIVTTKDLKGDPIGQELSVTASRRIYSAGPRAGLSPAIAGSSGGVASAPRGGRGTDAAFQLSESEHAQQQQTQQQAALPGVWSETKVQTITVKTDPKTGIGRATMTLPDGGSYVLRVEAKDQFGHLVSAESSLFMSDNSDETKLRVFSDRENYKVGESIAVDVHSRIAWEHPGRPDDKTKPVQPLALITYEGEEIIGYETRSLLVGHNKLDLPVKNAHFPNFAVSVTVMDTRKPVVLDRLIKADQKSADPSASGANPADPNAGPNAPGRLHAASREFTVERQLNITLTPDKSAVASAPRGGRSVEAGAETPETRNSKPETPPTYRPREEMSLQIAVTDQQGNPVQAEVGLTMIDTALLSRFPDLTPNIISFFQEGARRQAQMRTETSCTFRYQAQTRAMVTELLAEQERLEDAEKRLAEMAQIQNETAQAAMPPPSASVSVAGEGFDRMEARTPAESLGYLAAEGEGKATLEGARGAKMKMPAKPGSADARERLGRLLKTRRTAGRAGGGGGAGGGQLFEDDQNADGATEAGYGLGDVDESTRFFFDKAGKDISSVGLAEVSKQVLNKRDEMLARTIVFSYDDRNVNQLMELVASLNKVFCDAPPGTYHPEVAYWNPRIVTDAAGKATVKIIIPDSSTKWKLIARGATPETLVGSGEAEVIAKDDFFIEPLTPPTYIEGDKSVPLARVHILTPYTGEIEVTLKAQKHDTASGASSSTGRAGPSSARSDTGAQPDAQPAPAVEISTQKRIIKSEGSGVYDVSFDPIAIPGGDNVTIELTATTLAEVPDAKRKLAAASAREVPIRPWGMRIESHESGIRTDSDFVELELPKGEGEFGQYHDARLSVAVGPSMQRWLIEEALETGRRWELIEHGYHDLCVAPPRTHADTASALLGALYASDYVRGQQSKENGAGASAGAGSGAKPATTGAMPTLKVGMSSEDSDDTRLLRDRAAGLLAQLLAAQNDDGGWPWAGKSDSDPWTTAYVAWSIGKAAHDGQSSPDAAIQKLKAYLAKAFADARTEQTELKAVVLHGIAWVDNADFAHANRLYRNRQTLSTGALAHLALTFVRLDRKPIAAEVLGVLETKLKETRRGQRTCKMLPVEGNSAWLNSELEVTALSLLAQLSVDPRADSVRPMVDYLAATARHDGWRPHKARGPVLAALATWYAQSKQEAANYTLAVLINGREVRKIASDETGSLRIDLDEKDLAGMPAQNGVIPKQRVEFKFAGRGEYAYAATLSGFSRIFPHPDKTRRDMLRINDRIVEQPTVEYKGRWITPGWSVANDYKVFRNIATQLAVGIATRVELNAWRQNSNLNAAGDRDYIVIQETIPAGFRLLPETVKGEFQSFDYSNNVLTLYYGSRQGINQASYTMVATTPGTYRLPPTIIRSIYRPDIYHVNASDKIVTVLPRGQKSTDIYQMSPDQLYNLGKLNFDDANFEIASAFLKELLAGKWSLNADPYRDAIRMLLGCSLRQDKHDDIVNYFEILKEKYPDLVIPFEDIVKVAASYAHTGQHERSYLIYRATADASFVRDSNVGSVLQQENRFLESIDFMENLWREHPDTPQVESIYYALSQTVYAKAENPAAIKSRTIAKKGVAVSGVSLKSGAMADPKSGSGAMPTPKVGMPAAGATRITRVDLIRESINLLESFLALYPESPIADEASYSLANAYLDLDQFQTVLTRSAKFIELFPKSKWLDRFRYIQALAYFHLGDFDKARGLAEQVSQSTFKDEQGVDRPSPNKWLALYIIGQIYHAQNLTAKAIEFYSKVKDQFSDAGEAVSFFEHKFVRLPEVTVFHPDAGSFRESDEWEKHLKSRERENGNKPSAAAGIPHSADLQSAAPIHDSPFVRLDYRNITSAVIQVYRVDLMKLALIEKNLSHITAVNLAGIKPLLERTVQLGDGKDYVDKSNRIDLEAIATAAHDAEAAAGSDSASASADADVAARHAVLQPGDATGAYLVICRGDELFTSGLVLVTPLAVEVQDDRTAQRVRVNVVDALSRGGVKNVHVKVIGDAMNRFVSGDTDLRGVFLADAVAGFPTAIARDPAGHFAFYRSEGTLLAMASKEMTARKLPSTPVGTKADYFQNLRLENRAIQTSNDSKLQACFDQGAKQKGVEVNKAQ